VARTVTLDGVTVLQVPFDDDEPFDRRVDDLLVARADRRAGPLQIGERGLGGSGWRTVVLVGVSCHTDHGFPCFSSRARESRE
jgi:hypothetical protein